MKATQRQKDILNQNYINFLMRSHKTIDSYHYSRNKYINAYDLCRFLLEPYCNTTLCGVDYQSYVNNKLQEGEQPYPLIKFKTNARDRLVKTISGAVNTLTKRNVSQGASANAQSILGNNVCFAQDKNGSIALVVPFNKKSLKGFLKDMNDKKAAKITATAKQLQTLTNQKNILSAVVTQHVLANCLLENNELGATVDERIDVIVEWLVQNFKKSIRVCAALGDGYKAATAIYRGAKGIKERAKEDSKLIANGQTKRQRNNHKARN